MLASKGLSMEKRLCFAAMGVAGVLFVVFLIDLVLGFRGTTFLVGTAGTGTLKGGMWVDIIAMICCAIVGYLAWDSWQDLR
jgi:hypothetical protein